MRADAADAKVSPRQEGNFKTKHLNIWMNAASAWLNMEQWNACADPTLSWEDFEGLDCCWIGGDLADKDDITALVLAAFDTRGRLIFKPRFWLPEDVLRHPEHAEGRGSSQYRTWSLGPNAPLTLTPGDWVDHNEVEAVVREWTDRFSVRKITFDQFSAAQAMAARLNEDLATEDNPLAQILHKKASTVTDPAKELEARVKAGPSRLRHDANPVMTWMASNAVVARRRDDTLLPIKESPMSANKIDGIDALVNAIHPAISALKPDVQQPEYNVFFIGGRARNRPPRWRF
jgi:phage terminase large subunit-like protein